ncbi:LTA synthase family protein [Lactiplantibacillus mudanjiangensis]|uniref:Membrane sulfatase, alkaline phosphatase superfamily protein [Lactobacillus plantarum ZJ316] n=1 Tax=Lactiplantibacillus mudanjiangensis TaxID=1296538 RepID=A0A660DX93_9LACO|nr:LTA synthase family protein [Lactiplantibacillus mudanjiangensis]VDG17485.1 Membrane sulfatase, alkaline phosphatase superfamily protein [Lactobacillus plantarum ZJ316] [Lactiplantibacillus mudanjiangensis]VDG24662.1 Membrane sulfatase, alkaline phosphatase superfamily protein [Lactobacillus plantarum ZJ316] [Lactiplantibacillus mudanjiangensis]VDG27686.1 Membrane sulfatase, alkaline phosphatase superfamily protein [Lactobacillus plantarum ZJ316] [Lactiplantibacillus mudanjiangensis]VDG32835
MSKFIKNTVGKVNTTLGFFTLTVVLFWLKTYIAYKTEFTLGVKGAVQQFILVLNPFPTAIILLGIALYFRGRLKYWMIMIIDALQTTWLFANILYYREFSDFMSAGVIKSSGAASNNLGTSLGQIIHATDFLVYADVVLLILLLVFKVIRIDPRPFKLRYAATITMIGVALFAVDLGMSEHDRSDLLTRTFDNNYIVKYLGLNTYAGYSFYQTEKESATRAKASSSDLKSVLAYLKKNKADTNIKYYGKAKGKNVFIIHLESFQQFLIDYKVKGKAVTPNLNKFYHNKSTLSFDNFYNQVAQGKTSDAEMMLENSLFGLPTGSAMTQYGTSNTFQAAPAILSQTEGYTTAAFHGDVASFWNRDNAYKSWGYNYFFYSSYYKEKSSYNIGYGLKDKIFFKDSVKYLEQLPQPFYAKLITLTNHYPYTLDKQNQSIDKTTTGDSTVDGYVQTAHYLDQAFAEFVTYLKKAGLYNNSMIVLYGDHYGISNNHRSAIAQLLGKKSVTNFDLAQFQKVPFMIHMKGLKGGINHTYGGEIDVLPTLLDLLGVKNDYIQFGNDLLSKDRNQTVAFRNGNFVSPTYTKIGSTVYNSKTGKVIENMTAAQKKTVKQMQNHVTTELSLSDRVIEGDLLRFYTPKGFKKVDKSKYSYKVSTSLKSLEELQKENKTSVLSKHKGKSTVDLYKTDAPELSSSSSSADSSSSSSK